MKIIDPTGILVVVHRDSENDNKFEKIIIYHNIFAFPRTKKSKFRRTCSRSDGLWKIIECK